MKTNAYMILLLFLGIFLIACEEEDIKVEYSSAYPLAGRWSVYEYYPDESVYPDGHPYHLDIYNTANSTDSIWIDNIWDSGIKARVAADVKNATFSVAESFDINQVFFPAYEFDDVVDIIDGKVINQDSIYFVVVIKEAESLSTIDSFYVAGVRYVGFPDEE